MLAMSTNSEQSVGTEFVAGVAGYKKLLRSSSTQGSRCPPLHKTGKVECLHSIRARRRRRSALLPLLAGTDS